MAHAYPTLADKLFDVLFGEIWDENKAEMAQVIFEVAGFPMQDAPLFCNVTEERRGVHGRYLVATQAIPAFTFVKTEKVRLVLTGGDLEELHLEFSAFNRRAVPELVGYPSRFAVMVQEQDIPHGSDMCCFVGKFLRSGLLDNAMVQDLMDFDAFDERYVIRTFSRLRIGDVLWLHFWLGELEYEFAAGTVWRVFSFILSHAFKNEARMLTFSPFCKANCPQERWDWYLAGSNEEEPPASEKLAGLDKMIGNFEEVEPWGRQTHVGEGQIDAAECVVFMKDVAVGEPVEMDYGDGYMLEPGSQLVDLFRGDELEKAFEVALRPFDARVLAGYRAYMASG